VTTGLRGRRGVARRRLRWVGRQDLRLGASAGVAGRAPARAKVSMMIMRPPQQRHGFGRARGWSDSASGSILSCAVFCGTASSWRARAILGGTVFAVNEQPVVTDAMQAFGQHMDQEAPDDGEWNAGATRYRNHKDLPPKGSTIPRSSRKSKEEHTHFGDGRPHGFWERLFPFRAQPSGGAVCVVQCRRGGLAGPELLGGAGLENLLSHGPGWLRRCSAVS
jgi:hypothetical protein